MVCGSPCCQQDITARKRPTSYGNSNSVQVFSAYTFAAKRAPDWPGGQAGPQEGRFELECGEAKASGQDLFYSICSCTHLVHVFPLSLSLPLCFCVLTQSVCNTPAKPPMGDTQTWGCHFSLPQPEQVNQKCRAHFKILTQVLELLLWQYSHFSEM